MAVICPSVANTGSECAGVGALCRPRVSACVCGCRVCRFWGRSWRKSAAGSGSGSGGPRSPRRIGHPCRRRGTRARGPPPGAVARPGGQKRFARKTRRRMMTGRCVWTGRTRGGQCPGQRPRPPVSR